MANISSKQVKTRAPHKCWGCGKSLPCGAKVERQTEADGGKIWSVYWCDDCMDYITSMPDRSNADEVGFGELMFDEEYIKFKLYRNCGLGVANNSLHPTQERG